MSLQTRLAALVTAIGADVKALQAIKGSSRIWIIPFDMSNVVANPSNTFDYATAATDRTPARGFRDAFVDGVGFTADIPADWNTWSLDIYHTTGVTGGNVDLTTIRSAMAVDATPYAGAVTVNNVFAVAANANPLVKVLSNVFNGVSGTGPHRFVLQRNGTAGGDTFAQTFYVYAALLRKVT